MSFQNPLLAEDIFVPDAEAHVWEDGRIYLYGSFDKRGAAEYCSDEYHVFSSDDMLHWTDHGVSFRFSDISWVGADCPYRSLYAPDCAFRDGTYYLYYCIPDGRCGVAASDRPEGPFKDICMLEGVHGIDPAVFIDDDGQAYIYWGQFDGVRGAKLDRDMVTLDLSSVCQPLSVKEHDFHEGSSVKKVNGKYIFAYTDTHRHKDIVPSGMATCIGYAVSDGPLSGFRYGGVIIDNFGCDPGTWNDHGSIACFKDQWYVFYHRSTHGAQFSRHVCAEKIEIGPDGSIPEVPMSCGDLAAGEHIKANRASRLYGHVRIGGEYLGLTGIVPGDRAEYSSITFGGETRLRLRGNTAGAVGVYLDGGFLCAVSAAQTFKECVPARFGPVSGKHVLELEFTAPGELWEIGFGK